MHNSKSVLFYLCGSCYRGRFSAILAFLFIFCSRLSALISVLCDIFTVKLDVTVPLLLTAAEVDLVGPGTTSGVFPDFCDDCSVFPSVAGRVAENAPPPPQTFAVLLFVSAPDDLVRVGRLFPLD